MVTFRSLYELLLDLFGISDRSLRYATRVQRAGAAAAFRKLNHISWRQVKRAYLLTPFAAYLVMDSCVNIY